MDKTISVAVFKKSLIVVGAIFFVAFFAYFFATNYRLFPAALVLPEGAGTIDSTNRYAYGENIGWIDFGSTDGLVGVGTSELTGYAWGENIGWISLNCINDDSCGIVNYKVLNQSGILSGYAYGENVGWINFRPALASPVQIDSTGNFSGYAWGENTGWISFNCSNTGTCGSISYKVVTTWVDPQQGTGGSVGSVGPTPVQPDVVAPIIGLEVVINGGEAATDKRGVSLTLKPKSAETVISGILISEDANFENVSVEAFEGTKNYILSEGNGQKTIYVKFLLQDGVTFGVEHVSIMYIAPVEPVAPETPVTPTPTTPSVPTTIPPKGTVPTKPNLPPSQIQPTIPPPSTPITPATPAMQQSGGIGQVFTQLISIIRDFFSKLFGN